MYTCECCVISSVDIRVEFVGMFNIIDYLHALGLLLKQILKYLSKANATAV